MMTKENRVWWDEGRINILKAEWAEGFSASVIAGHLGTTRSAVMGKVMRLNLSSPKKPRSSRAHYSSIPRSARQIGADGNIAKRMRKLITSDFAELPVAPLPAELAPPAIVEGEIHFVNCGLQHLTNHSCRWPISDPGTDDFRFCGEPSADLGNKRPYCMVHARMAVNTFVRGWSGERRRNPTLPQVVILSERQQLGLEILNDSP